MSNMSTLKAQVDLEQVKDLLLSHFVKTEHIQMLKGGEASQAYAFIFEDHDYILRVNHHADYSREIWAAKHINNATIPIPHILKFGKYEKYYWIVSEKAPGGMMYDLPEKEMQVLLPQMVDILHTIHNIDISTSTGYGVVNDKGNAPYKTWREYIENFDVRGDFIDWDVVLQQAEPNYKKFIETAWELGYKLIKHLPEVRLMLHGDYNLANIIASNGYITGVIDWNCVYGDPLRDIAWVDFWAPFLHFSDEYLKLYPINKAKKIILCYQLFIGARSLGFFIHTQQPHKGTYILEQVEKIIKLAKNEI